MGSETQTGRTLKCLVVVENDVLMVSRSIPPKVLDNVGFIAWNRFCDRLDGCLGPLRSLIEENTSDNGRKKEDMAKITALQALQETCDRFTEIYPALKFTLYCPFHSNFAENWHIQISFSPSDKQGPISSGALDIPSVDVRDGASVIRDLNLNQEPVLPRDITNEAGQESRTQTEEIQNQDNPASHTDGLDSPEENLPPSFHMNEGLGALGKDYIEHTVKAGDTLQGLCILYNIEPFRLKQANLLSGDNESLLLAPHKTIAIPISEGFYSRVQDTDSRDYKLIALRKQVPKLSEKEATAYLELADWDLDDALAAAREDIEWEKDAKVGLF